MRVIGSRVSNWTTVAEFSELAIPTELFPKRGSLDGRFEA